MGEQMAARIYPLFGPLSLSLFSLFRSLNSQANQLKGSNEDTQLKPGSVNAFVVTFHGQP